MAGVKFTSYIDAIEKQMRAETLADHAGVLEVVEHEHNEILDTLKELKRRIATIEAYAELFERRISYRIEQLEKKGGPESGVDK